MSVAQCSQLHLQPPFPQWPPSFLSLWQNDEDDENDNDNGDGNGGVVGHDDDHNDDIL